MLNRIYSILMHGLPADEGYGRRIDPYAYAASPDELSRTWLRRLVDYPAGANARSANAEWLLQLMLRSPIRDAVLIFDELNTYERIPLALTPTLDWADLLQQLRAETPKLQRITNVETIWGNELLWTTQLATFAFNIVQDNAFNQG